MEIKTKREAGGCQVSPGLCWKPSVEKHAAGSNVLHSPSALLKSDFWMRSPAFHTHCDSKKTSISASLVVPRFLIYFPNPLPHRHISCFKWRIDHYKLKNIPFLPHPAVGNAGQTCRMNLLDCECCFVVGQYSPMGWDFCIVLV